MSKKIKIVGDEFMEGRIIKNASRLNISVHDLIDRYIRRELAIDNGFRKRQMSFDELKERLERDAERDKKRGIFPKNLKN